ncbi:putative ribonuclease h1 [Diaporthe ampelina]|uniref:ribonuclease H n=1 Tax=Diaporthe ampelina TaxID=1214573 RepID=A0A0G2F600_9PEZI|nr:putative ribonuclease h1 [Diaporthe ampelina]
MWKTCRLEDYPAPTSQRAEITAIILALEWALERHDELDTSPRLRVTIRSDSRYAVDCMTSWIHTWARNGWTNSRGFEVANRDLIERASDLDDRVCEVGWAEYIWVPRSDNADADALCRKELDEQEAGDWFRP